MQKTRLVPQEIETVYSSESSESSIIRILIFAVRIAAAFRWTVLVGEARVREEDSVRVVRTNITSQKV